MTAAGSDRDHCDGVWIVFVGQKPVDDAEPLRVFTPMVEAKPSSPAEVTRDVTVIEALVCLASPCQIGDG